MDNKIYYMIRVLVFCGVLIQVPKLLIAQQDPLFSHYLTNRMIINPAFTADKNCMVANVHYRTQWVNKVDGAPKTYTVSVAMPLPQYNIGVGLYYIEDQIGPTIEREITSSYSYFLQEGSAMFGFGLQFGYKFLSQDLIGNIGNTNDEVLNNVAGSAWKPNFSVGTFYRNNQFYLAGSVKDILNQNYETNTEGGDVVTTYETNIHYYFMGAYFYSINSDFLIRPSAMFRYVKGADLDYDVTATLFYRSRLALGISVRAENALSVLLQGEVYNGLTIGYSYDYYHNALKTVNSGSHEITLEYCFQLKKEKDGGRITTPRYF